MLVETKLKDFVEMVAAKTPTPGGGSVSAAVCAMGAALGIMAARYSPGTTPSEAAERLESVQGEFLRLVDLDAAAYGRVDAALGLPKTTVVEKNRRKEALQSALKEAAEVPLQGMRLAVGALEAVRHFAADSNKNLASDLGGAALMLEAGLLGCGLNVKGNARSIQDAALAAQLEEEAGRLVAEAGRLRGEVLCIVHERYTRK